jgi:RNA polymerase sigma-70 factor (ECF subfamily)
MPWDNKKDEELHDILNRFSSLIRIHIIKFNPQKFGVDPDDISQDVRIKIWHLLQNEKNIKSFPSYLKKIVNSSVIDFLRKRKRDDGILFTERQMKVSEIKKDYPAAFSPEEEFRDTVARAIESLIESRRKVVRLHLLDMTIDEISSFYNWSSNKTRNLLYRGLSDLKRILKDKGIDYENHL